jgi:NCS1 family nucleobase:cation symporter-1
VLVAGTVDWAAVSALPSAPAMAVLGALVLVITGFGMGWVNVAADYTRYLPRSSSERGIVAWTTFGASLGPVVLLIVGLLLAGSSKGLADAVAADPIGALTTALPTWFLVPFALAAVLGLVGAAVLDIYSSGLALLSLGLPAPRWVAALIDGVLMVIGTVYVVFVAGEFLPQFTGFLVTLGVPVAAWAGVLMADIALRRTYADEELYRAGGRYGSVRWPAVILLVVATVVGWGLVTNSQVAWLTWQGYLLDLGLGGREGPWAYANLGVLLALVLCFLVTLLTSASTVRRQEVAAAIPAQPGPGRPSR